MDALFSAFLIFIPLAVGADFLHASPGVIFFFAALGIVPLAKTIGDATEHLSRHAGPAIGGLFNVTFGNATELIIGAFALKAGLLEIVKASLTGSIISNLLLVLGTAMFAGGIKHTKQAFNKTAAMASGSSLFIAVIALVIPAIFIQTVPVLNGNIIEELSVFVSVFLVILYFASLLFSLRTHKHLYETDPVAVGDGWSVKRSLGMLLVATIAVAWMSNILIGAVEPLIAAFGWTELFIGVIFIAIVGNAAEHTSAISMALKNKMDVALQISIGSATQIAMFVAPFLVIISLLFPSRLSLVFNTFELITIVLSILLVNLVITDGESNWLEGLQLMMAYAIIGVAFFFHP